VEKAHVTCYLVKNSLAVKKGVALFKMASVKKVVKSKGWPRNGYDGIEWQKNFNKNNSGQFVLPHPSLTRNQRRIVSKILPSSYTITAISWPSL